MATQRNQRMKLHKTSEEAAKFWWQEDREKLYEKLKQVERVVVGVEHCTRIIELYRDQKIQYFNFTKKENEKRVIAFLNIVKS